MRAGLFARPNVLQPRKDGEVYSATGLVLVLDVGVATLLFYGKPAVALAVGVADRPGDAVCLSSMRWAETWEFSFHSPSSCTMFQTIEKRGVLVLSTMLTFTVAVAVVPRTSFTSREFIVTLCI